MSFNKKQGKMQNKFDEIKEKYENIINEKEKEGSELKD